MVPIQLTTPRKRMEMPAKSFWTLICVCLTVILYTALTFFTAVDPFWLVALIMAWTASPLLFFGSAYAMENVPTDMGGRGTTVAEVFKSVFSLRKQAWSFIFGDLVLLPGAFVVAALRWDTADHYLDVSLWWWWLLSLAIGAGFGFSFHFKVDKPAYAQAGKLRSLNAPTKLLHDFVSYPVLFGGLLFSFVPMLFEVRWDWNSTWHVYVILALVGAWLTLRGVVDAKRAKMLIPWGHPGYDLETEECIPYN